MGPDLRRLMVDPDVQAILRSICHLETKQIRLILNFVDLLKRSGLR
jgi:hypothetical protein